MPEIYEQFVDVLNLFRKDLACFRVFTTSPISRKNKETKYDVWYKECFHLLHILIQDHNMGNNIINEEMKEHVLKFSNIREKFYSQIKQDFKKN